MQYPSTALMSDEWRASATVQVRKRVYVRALSRFGSRLGTTQSAKLTELSSSLVRQKRFRFGQYLVPGAIFDAAGTDDAWP